MKAAVTCLHDGNEITIDDALEIRDNSAEKPYFSCGECKEPLRAHKAGNNGHSAAHFEHLEKNYACSFSGGKKQNDGRYSIDHPAAVEGYQLDTTIMRGTRNAKLASKRKWRDSYTCQACGFKRKVNGRYVIECHHINPIGIGGRRETKIDDLVSLCPTCHRVAHTRRLPLSVAEIKCELGIV